MRREYPDTPNSVQHSDADLEHKSCPIERVRKTQCRLPPAPPQARRRYRPWCRAGHPPLPLLRIRGRAQRSGSSFGDVPRVLGAWPAGGGSRCRHRGLEPGAAHRGHHHLRRVRRTGSGRRVCVRGTGHERSELQEHAEARAGQAPADPAGPRGLPQPARDLRGFPRGPEGGRRNEADQGARSWVRRVAASPGRAWTRAPQGRCDERLLLARHQTTGKSRTFGPFGPFT